ncbi:MAG TPA: hypothetical protein ENI08_00340 [Candidatus Dependentiae bacterium]|nr:hypothetical protein [Candidatus Dependentiae bacterium]
MKKNSWLAISILFSAFPLYLTAVEIETILEATILCGDARFKPSVTKQPKHFQPYDSIVPWLSYTSAKKTCFVATGYQNKTYALSSIEIIISRAGQLLATAPESSQPKIQLQLKVVSTNDKNITLSDADAAKLLRDSKIIGNAFDLVNNIGNVQKEQCYLLATKKKNLSQEELDAALENIFIAATGVAGLFR